MSAHDADAARELITQALMRPAHERDSFLEESCPDPALRAEISTILRTYVDAAIPVYSRSEGLVSPDFSGTARFEVRRRLGVGAFGTVYDAWDRVQEQPVAIKVLHDQRPELLFRFKREFRSLVHVRHPNLVRLYELFSEGQQWFFSMELVEGLDFLSHVRPGGMCRVDRLRPAMLQLAEGIHALHQANLLHRDVKPANALVADSGRVVLLDFGLVRELIPSGGVTLHSQVVGTPAYMAPEQFLPGGATQSSDWYSIGVMLFQALTGRLPYTRSVSEPWKPDFTDVDPRFGELDAAEPRDLSVLCRGLLRSGPQQRPTPEEILALLSPTRVARQDRSIRTPRHEGEYFVGRHAEMQQLEEAFTPTLDGAFGLLLLHGPSGIGKSALLRQFIARIVRQHPNAVVLIGSCYEFESVPYKGFDALIDRLCDFLQQLPASHVDALLPRDAALLPKLFPVLGRVAAIANAPARSSTVPDAQELRQRGFRALRELLARLGDRYPLLLWIDDVQWADRDSITLLAELCAPPQQPPLLFALTYRSEERASNSTLIYLYQVLAHQRPVGGWLEIALTHLHSGESADLLHRLLSSESGVSDALRMRMIREADGHPLFLHELARAAASDSARLHFGNASTGLALTEVLQQRIADLPVDAREVLDFVCVATQPIPASVAMSSARSGNVDDRAEVLGMLIRQRFIRSSGANAERWVEPYHDQVRAAVLAMLAPDVIRLRHARLAAVLAREPNIEPQILVIHYREAGDRQATFDAAVQAARFAESQLAFERAASMYEAALATGDLKPAQRTDLSRRLADMLRLAGRGRDSAHAYLAAAANAATVEALELRRLAADQLMRSGHLDEGLELFEQLAEQMGISLAATPAEAVRRIVAGRLAARAALLLRWPDRPRRPLSPNASARINLLRNGGVVLNAVDPVLSAYFQVQHIVEAFKNGDDSDLSIALAMEAAIRLSGRYCNTQRAFALLDRADAHARASGSPNAIGFIGLVRAYVDYLRCRVPEGIINSRAAIEFYREHCTGVTWETTTAHAMLYWFLCWAGQVEQVRDELPQLLKDGAARGDVNLQVSLRLIAYTHYAYLCSDRAEESIRECQWALAHWSRRGFHIQDFGAMFNIAESHLYLGNNIAARDYVMNSWQKMTGSLFLRWQVLRIIAWFLRGKVTLGCWEADPKSAVLRRDLQRCVSGLKRTALPWSEPMTNTLEAGFAAGQGRRTEAIQRLNKAIDGFDRVSLRAMAAATRHFCGVLQGGELGRAQMTSAADFLQAQQVVNPASFLRMLLPGSWERLRQE
jgi:eukaryotic-like serine/threonine-protein kinase